MLDIGAYSMGKKMNRGEAGRGKERKIHRGQIE